MAKCRIYPCSKGFIYVFILLLIFETKYVSSNIGSHLIRAKRHVVPNFLHEWAGNNCRKFRNLFKRNSFAIDRLDKVINQALFNDRLSSPDKTFQVRTFQLFQRELNESESLVFQSLIWLDNTLKGDYKDLMDMMSSSKARLDALKDATLKEQEDYNELMKAEKFVEDRKELEKRENHTQIQRVIDDILDDVALAADKLEQELDDHVFDNALHGSSMGKRNNIETVVRLDESADTGAQKENGTENKHDKQSVEIMKLVDSEDNQFVLSKGKDTTIPHEDHHFIQDVLYLLLLCFACGWLCNVIKMPTMFGYIVAGVLLGPSGFNILKSLVQVETLGEFGVFFILFSVGLEFSPDKLKKVFRVATLGTILMMGLMIGIGVTVGYAVITQTNESAFVAACLSLSSTPLIVKFLASTTDSHEKKASIVSHHPRHERQTKGTYDYSSVLLGILIMQDVMLGILMAILPSLALSSSDTTHQNMAAVYASVAVKLGAALCGVVSLCWVLSKVFIGWWYHYLLEKTNKEILVLATVGLAFLMLMLTNWLHISMELGCFLAGALISSKGPELSEHIEGIIQPIKDFLGCIFFASIGLHVFPSFLIYELTILMTLTIAVVGAKFVIGVLVLALLLPSGSGHIKWIVSAGLAQVSEFSFVLGSRARRLGLISREVYLLILSVTTLSLIFAPAVWKATLWYMKIKYLRKQNSAKKKKVPTATLR